MAGAGGQPAGSSGADPGARRLLAYLILGGLALLFCTIVVVVAGSLGGEDESASASSERRAEARDLPAYWKVRRGDTYVRIAERTGLTVEELETLNPKVDPGRIQPGQRLKLREDVPERKRKPVGPKWVTLRAGDSFGSIAAKTGKSITRLRQLNRKLEPTKLQPGDRVRLR